VTLMAGGNTFRPTLPLTIRQFHCALRESGLGTEQYL
jgi:hypothetical protein